MVTLDAENRARIYAEASVWLARLQSEDRTPETESAFQDWLKSNPDHEAAFERATEVWEMLPGAVAVKKMRPANDNGSGRKALVIGAVAAVAAAVVIAFSLGSSFLAARPTIYQTGPGQQQVMTLADGSRVSLNTDSEIAVSYSGKQRHIDLVRGEVLFDVAHNPAKPFLVRVGNEQVRALGTSFVVRRETDQIAVTLFKGRVELSNKVASPLGQEKFETQTILSPGQRATINAQAQVTLDRPVLESLVAWRHGEVVFSNTTLGEAARELNRYGPVKIAVSDPAVAHLRVSGIFETNNAPEFAISMAQLHGLKVQRSADRIELIRQATSTDGRRAE